MTKCLSLQQPYASLILWRANKDDPKMPLKPIENRKWPLPRDFELPQRVLIHASLTMYPGATLERIHALMTPAQWSEHGVELQEIFRHGELNRGKKSRWFGHILGSVVITGQVTESDNPWFFGPYGFSMEYPELLAKPVPYKGRLGFFPVTLEGQT